MVGTKDKKDIEKERATRTTPDSLNGYSATPVKWKLWVQIPRQAQATKERKNKWKK